MALLTYVIKYTKIGRMCRATQQDRKMASILGINTDRVISTVFIIGAAMAALAGVLITLNYGTFDFYVGFVIGIKAFTAAVLGGIGSLPGAMLGGIILGTPNRCSRACELGLQRRLQLLAARHSPGLPALGLLGRPDPKV